MKDENGLFESDFDRLLKQIEPGNPPDFRNPISVSKAKKAISDYKKALGQPDGLAELTVFYCEEVFVFLASCGMDDEGFHDALVRMFEQALKYVLALPKAQQVGAKQTLSL